jgi:hypothetical protein
MPKKAKETESNEESLLVTTAKTIGKAAGKIAAVSGVVSPDAGQSARTPKGKLAPKNKARLPRRQKKAQKKARSAG